MWRLLSGAATTKAMPNVLLTVALLIGSISVSSSSAGDNEGGTQRVPPFPETSPACTVRKSRYLKGHDAGKHAGGGHKSSGVECCEACAAHPTCVVAVWLRDFRRCIFKAIDPNEEQMQTTKQYLHVSIVVPVRGDAAGAAESVPPEVSATDDASSSFVRRIRALEDSLVDSEVKALEKSLLASKTPLEVANQLAEVGAKWSAAASSLPPRDSEVARDLAEVDAELSMLDADLQTIVDR